MSRGWCRKERSKWRRVQSAACPQNTDNKTAAIHYLLKAKHPTKCLKLLINFNIIIHKNKLVLSWLSKMPTVTQLVSSKAKTGKQWLSASNFKFFITPLHIEGPDPPGSQPQGLRTAPGWGRGWQQDRARRSHAGASFCLDARPASYSRGRGTTPVDSEMPGQHKRENFSTTKGNSVLQLSPTACNSISTHTNY